MVEVVSYVEIVKYRQVMDLDVRIAAFAGPGFRSARQVPCGDASRVFLDHLSEHLSSVLGRRETDRVWNPGPQKPPIIRNKNHHPKYLLRLFLATQRSF